MFNALLIAVAVATSSPAVQPKPAKQLVCGSAHSLAQGSGHVKICEWK